MVTSTQSFFILSEDITWCFKESRGRHFFGNKHGGNELRMAPELDGLHCFETLAKDGADTKLAVFAMKWPVQHAVTAAVCAPEFDGVYSFETLISVSGNVKPPVAEKGTLLESEIRAVRSVPGRDLGGRQHKEKPAAVASLNVNPVSMKSHVLGMVYSCRYAPEFDGLHCFETLLKR